MKNQILTLEEARKKAINYHLYDDGSSYRYSKKNGFMRLIIDGVDVLEGLKAVDCYLRNDGSCSYEDQDGKWHRIQKRIKQMTPNVKEKIQKIIDLCRTTKGTDEELQIKIYDYLENMLTGFDLQLKKKKADFYFILMEHDRNNHCIQRTPKGGISDKIFKQIIKSKLSQIDTERDYEDDLKKCAFDLQELVRISIIDLISNQY